MARLRFNFETKEWEEVGRSAPAESRSPGIVTDIIDGVRSHADGNYYDSKSRMRKAAKAAGCYELGPNDAAPTRRVQKMESPKETLIRLMNGG